MAGEQSPGTGSGVAAPGAGTPTPGVGATPAAAPGVGGTPGTPTPRVVPEDVLPEQLRGRTPQEQKFILGQLAQTVQAQAARLKELEALPRGIARPVPVEEDEKPKKPIEERILEEPEAVIAEVVRKLYGPTVERLEGGVEEVVESTSAREYDDWEDVKDDVNALLREAKAPKTKANINLAYETVIGRRTLQQRRQARAAVLNPDIPIEGAPKSKLPELTGLEKEIFEASGMTREDWEKMADSSNLEIKVPTGKKREAPHA